MLHDQTKITKNLGIVSKFKLEKYNHQKKPFLNSKRKYIKIPTI